MTIQKILLEFDPKRENLLPLLGKVNQNFGFVSEPQISLIAEYFSLSESQVFETASFYDLINLKENGKIIIQVCSSANCAMRDSFRLISEIEKILRIKLGDDNNRKFKLEEISCLGRCAEGPIVAINGKIFEKVTGNSIYEILKDYI